MRTGFNEAEAICLGKWPGPEHEAGEYRDASMRPRQFASENLKNRLYGLRIANMLQ